MKLVKISRFQLYLAITLMASLFFLNAFGQSKNLKPYQLKETKFSKIGESRFLESTIKNKVWVQTNNNLKLFGFLNNVTDSTLTLTQFNHYHDKKSEYKIAAKNILAVYLSKKGKNMKTTFLKKNNQHFKRYFKLFIQKKYKNNN